MKRVFVHIDRLVLKGFRRDDRYAFAEALREEMGHLLADPDVARHLVARGNSVQLKGGGVRLASGTRPAQVATQTARGIARGIKS